MPKPSKRVRVYGSPRPTFDPDLMVQVLILLGRDLHRSGEAKARGRTSPRRTTGHGDATGDQT